MSIFVDNLYAIMESNALETYSQLGKMLTVNENTLKSWIAKNRTISLMRLDVIADTLGLPSYLLIKKGFREDGVNYNIPFNKNNSQKIFSSNLQRIFILKSKTSWDEREALFNGNFSIASLMAYTRDKNPRTPSLNKIDIMAECLGVESYLMIKEDAFK